MVRTGHRPRAFLGDWAAMVYGTIVVGTLLAVETASAETYAETLIGTLIALLVYWLAHAYATLLGRRMGSGERLSFGGVLAAMRHEAPILAGAAPSLTALIVCWVAGAGLSDAVTIALWTSAAMVLFIELIAGMRAHLAGRQLMVQVAIGAVLGLLMILLRLVLH